MGATVDAGAKRRLHVMKRCAKVPSRPSPANKAHVVGGKLKLNSPIMSGNTVKAKSKIIDAWIPLIACSLIGSIARAILRVTIIKSENTTATPRG